MALLRSIVADNIRKSQKIFWLRQNPRIQYTKHQYKNQDNQEYKDFRKRKLSGDGNRHSQSEWTQSSNGRSTNHHKRKNHR